MAHFSQPNGYILVRDYAVGDSAQVSAYIFIIMDLLLELPSMLKLKGCAYIIKGCNF